MPSFVFEASWSAESVIFLIFELPLQNKLVLIMNRLRSENGNTLRYPVVKVTLNEFRMRNNPKMRDS
jgi:hypothetical protein